MFLNQTRLISGVVTVALLGIFLADSLSDAREHPVQLLTSYIVQASGMDEAMQALHDVGGGMSHELGIVRV